MKNNNFNEFSEEQQAEYQKYAQEHWDSRLVRQSVTRWNALDAEGKKALMSDGERITLAIAESIPLGEHSPRVQQLVADWHAYINRYYDCSLEIFAQLGIMYREDPRFFTFYEKIHPALPIFLSRAISIYTRNPPEDPAH
jgi:hypothetical protein